MPNIAFHLSKYISLKKNRVIDSIEPFLGFHFTMTSLANGCSYLGEVSYRYFQRDVWWNLVG